ncbi:MAG: hypothetical protein A2340_12040 [Lentisphaerae bacterium RIFOXYB12_FULL_60_10]|nr:MAG: hypothetical protein A2269_06355 [Lentisphaerae bacterium RIFOXYA12_FULL_60_10]OGV78512.1 MAG: hypothetical protein A2340_12040 [Lentisphaerae bacterium RIFOXYB12_FULL_60_10]
MNLQPTRKTVAHIVILLGILAAWYTGGTMNRKLAADRAARHPHLQSLETAPPAVLFTTLVLGGFRGLLVDMLWLRVSVLQDQGDYVEVVQLSDWITRLDPNSTEVWQFHAWNMAYNISVMMPDPVDRWRWIQNGIHLLRDEGIVLNPSEPQLYHALGWLYQHKIGGTTDDAHGYYKRQLAGTMQTILEHGFPDYESLRNDTTRTERLRREFKLDTTVMEAVDRDLGPLDWRAPETHAIYWAWQGLPLATGNNALPCERMIIQSLSELVRHGRLHFDRETDTYRQSPDTNLLSRVLTRFETTIQTFDLEGFHAGRRTLVTDAARIFHNQGDPATARRLFERFNAELPPPMRFPDFETFIKSPSDTYYLEPRHNHDVHPNTP